MALKTTGIDHVNLQVIDLDASCRFYRDLLGFEILEEIPDQNGRIIGDHEAKLALYQTDGMTRYEKRGFSHVGFHIDDFGAIESRCGELGIAIKYGGPLSWPKSRSIYIDDPNGYEIELSEVAGGGLA